MYPGPIPSPLAARLPDVVLYGRPGCHLCEQAHVSLVALLDERAAAGRSVPAIVERDITTDREWERAFLLTIPVVEVAGRRLELATSVTRLRTLLSDALDGADPVNDALRPGEDAPGWRDDGLGPGDKVPRPKDNVPGPGDGPTSAA